MMSTGMRNGQRSQNMFWCNKNISENTFSEVTWLILRHAVGSEEMVKHQKKTNSRTGEPSHAFWRHQSGPECHIRSYHGCHFDRRTPVFALGRPTLLLHSKSIQLGDTCVLLSERATITFLANYMKHRIFVFVWIPALARFLWSG